jgi:hypothetical protein
MKENIQRSVPAGRTYRKTAIVRKSSRRTSGLKLAVRNGKVIVGYNFHRASRRGQPPAIDSGRLINGIRSTRIAAGHGRVGVAVDYALPLDDPEGLDRPFFSSRVALYRPVFFENIRRAWLGK